MFFYVIKFYGDCVVSSYSAEFQVFTSMPLHVYWSIIDDDVAVLYLHKTRIKQYYIWHNIIRINVIDLQAKYLCVKNEPFVTREAWYNCLKLSKIMLSLSTWLLDYYEKSILKSIRSLTRICNMAFDCLASQVRKSLLTNMDFMILT